MLLTPSFEDHGTSMLSLYSTPASKNQTLGITIPATRTGSKRLTQYHDTVDLVSSTGRKRRRTGSLPNDAAIPSSEAGTSRAQSRKGLFSTSSIVRTSDGTVIIEDLDTPAIRREKRLRRKAEKARKEQSSQISGPSHLGLDGDVDAESTLSSLSSVRSSPDTSIQGAEVDMPNREQRISDDGEAAGNVGASGEEDAEGDYDLDPEAEFDLAGKDLSMRKPKRVKAGNEKTPAVQVRSKGATSRMLPPDSRALFPDGFVEGGTLGTCVYIACGLDENF
jgi:hypothetical protein